MGTQVQLKQIKPAKQNGQVTIEAVLLMVFFVALFGFLSKSLEEFGFLNQMIYRPWLQVSGLIENGVWGLPDETTKYHPTHHSRKVTVIGDRTF